MSFRTGLAEPLLLGRVTLRNRVFVAPMSGITDMPFRRRAHAAGAGMVVSEMVASGELTKGRQGSLQRIRPAGLDVHVVQLAGREAQPLAEAARIAAGEGADIIDINMGCPAKKVTGGYAGSALMRDIDHAVTLIAAVVGAVAVPVTVKMRLGWDETALNAPMLARRAEQAGVRMITVHGRTRCQFYTGQADWRAIRRVKEAVTIPVVANGDISSQADAQRALAMSGADAVMVGRAGCGAPWVAGAIASAVGPGAPMKPDDIAAYVVEHYEEMLSFYGVASGLRQARKHLGWYLDGQAPDIPANVRAAILRADDPQTVVDLLRRALDHAGQMQRSAA